AGQENHVDTPVFQAPDASSNQSAVKAETAGNDNRDAAQGAQGSQDSQGSQNAQGSQNRESGNNNRNRSNNNRRGGRGRRGSGNANEGANNNSGNQNRQGGNRGNRGGGRRNVVKSMQGADLTRRLPEPPKAPRNGLRIYALGGISEIGRNMTVFEYNNRLLIVDCGVLFPSSGEPGVDLILPDFGPIEKHLDRVDALVVTHGHEDHIGAIPWLLKLRPDIPILASRFTLAL